MRNSEDGFNQLGEAVSVLIKLYQGDGCIEENLDRYRAAAIRVAEAPGELRFLFTKTQELFQGLRGLLKALNHSTLEALDLGTTKAEILDILLWRAWQETNKLPLSEATYMLSILSEKTKSKKKQEASPWYYSKIIKEIALNDSFLKNATRMELASLISSLSNLNSDGLLMTAAQGSGVNGALIVKAMNRVIESIAQFNLAEFSSQELISWVDELSEVIERFGDKNFPGALDPFVVFLSRCELTNFETNQLDKLAKGFLRALGLKTAKLDELARGFLRVFGEVHWTNFEQQQPAERVRNGVAVYILQRDLAGFSSHALANLLYGLGKGVNRRGYELLLGALDQVVVHLSQRELANFETQQLVELFNGLDEVLGRVGGTPKFADANPTLEAELTGFEPQKLADLVRGQIAGYILQRDLTNFKPQQLANVVNRLGRGVPKLDSGHNLVLEALSYLARYLWASYIQQGKLVEFSDDALTQVVKGLSQAITKAEIGFSSVATRTDCQELFVAMVGIAEHTLQRDLARFSNQALASWVEGFSKVVGIPGCEAVLVAMNRLAESILQRKLVGFDGQALASLLDGFSKVSTRADCRHILKVVKSIANYVKRISKDGLAGFGSKTVVNLIKGLSKWVEVPGCKPVLGAMEHIAKHLLRRDLADFDDPALADLLEGLNPVRVVKRDCKLADKVISRIIAYRCERSRSSDCAVQSQVTFGQVEGVGGISLWSKRGESPIDGGFATVPSVS